MSKVYKQHICTLLEMSPDGYAVTIIQYDNQEWCLELMESTGPGGHLLLSVLWETFGMSRHFERYCKRGHDKMEPHGILYVTVPRNGKRYLVAQCYACRKFTKDRFRQRKDNKPC